MTLKEKLKEDLKISMKSGETIKRGIIRLVLSEIAAEDARRKVGQNHLDDFGIQGVIKSMVKNLTGIPEELKTEELKKEIEILNSYLPELMSEEETRIKVEEVISETEVSSMKDIGKVMGAFTAKYKGKADNKLVMKLIKERLTF